MRISAYDRLGLDTHGHGGDNEGMVAGMTWTLVEVAGWLAVGSAWCLICDLATGTGWWCEKKGNAEMSASWEWAQLADLGGDPDELEWRELARRDGDIVDIVAVDEYAPRVAYDDQADEYVVIDYRGNRLY